MHWAVATAKTLDFPPYGYKGIHGKITYHVKSGNTDIK